MTKIKALFTESRKAWLLKWWSIAAVYFFVGWGTNLGNSHLIDFVFYLGVAIGVVQMLIIEPVINGMLKITIPIKTIGGVAKSKSLHYILSILKSLLVVLIMVYVYAFINRILIAGFNLPSEQIVIAGEPITFAILYMIVDRVLTWLRVNVTDVFKKALDSSRMS